MKEPGPAVVEQGALLQACGGRTGCGTPAAGPGRAGIAGRFFVRDNRHLRVRGVTYGPFAPNGNGESFPRPEQVVQDFAQMRLAGVNAIRTYDLPPPWFLDLADAEGMNLLVDVPWPRHLCFLDGIQTRREARRLVGQAARDGQGHSCVLGYSIANEIPANIIRWHGRRRVERFLAELADTARQADPDGLITYANFPPTEYLELSFLDFATFNVYLHDREAFRRYLLRLQNLVGDKPLLLGELGQDTLRMGESAQADYLAGHVREATLSGLAGAFVFSWTDDWFTGGHAIQDWAFGITRADRSPKASYHALRAVFECAPAQLLPQTPRVSVVVCSYNGGATLERCLRSLLALDYPDCEVIVVDDGSTDDTRGILARFPTVRAIHQANQGLSAARNVGLKAATGSIIAFTDADCFADANWLTHLVHPFQHTDAAAVGGPNLAPEDGRLAGCVAAAPGQPTHVLESDQVAEHIPGCNMAFRREALLAVNGFDPIYRKAGDDVDVCWRLQQADYWITFAPGAFVWHHRRQTPRAYLRQQAGYGEAEALLRFKHPDKFNGRGDGKWRGVLYGPSPHGLCLSGALIYRGTFGTGLFQCLYQPGPAHWAMLPTTLEWHLAASLAGLAAFAWPLVGAVGAAMLLLSLLVATLQAAQARLAPAHDGPGARLLVMALCYTQPLVRSWGRYRTRLFTSGWHALRYSEGRDSLAGEPRPSEYLRACHPNATTTAFGSGTRLSVDRQAHGGLLECERRGSRAAAGRRDPVSERTPLGQGHRLRLVRLGLDDLVPSLDRRPRLHGAGESRRQQVSHPRALPPAAEWLPLCPGGLRCPERRLCSLLLALAGAGRDGCPPGQLSGLLAERDLPSGAGPGPVRPLGEGPRHGSLRRIGGRVRPRQGRGFR